MKQRSSGDAEMNQAKKGNQWHFGMKAHISVDAASGLVHTVIGTAANVADVTQAHELLHGQETHAFGDVGYQGVDKRRSVTRTDRPRHLFSGSLMIGYTATGFSPLRGSKLARESEVRQMSAFGTSRPSGTSITVPASITE